MLSFIVNKIKNTFWGPLFLYLILVAVHLIFNLEIRLPMELADEFGYLGNARYLAGGNHFVLSGIVFYHFGYSLFIVPLFNMFGNNLPLLHQGAMVVNAFLISSLYFFLFYISRHILKLPRNAALLSSFIISFYPTFFTTANLVWSENLNIPLVGAFLVVFWLFLKNKNFFWSIIFGFLTGFLYTAHSKFLIALIFIIIYLIIFAILQKKFRIRVFLALGIMAVVLFLTTIINNQLIAVGWQNLQNIRPGTAEMLISKLSTLSGIKLLLEISLGHLLYLSQSTYGLFLVAIVYVVRYLYLNRGFLKDKDLNATSHFIFMLLLISSGIYLASIIICSASNFIGDFRADHIIYGRHVDNFVAIYLTIALAVLYKDAKHKYYYIYIVLSTLPFIIYFFDTYNILSHRLYGSPIFGVLAIILFLPKFHLGLISAVAIFLFFIIINTRKINWVASYVVILLIFMVLTLRNLQYQKEVHSNLSRSLSANINFISMEPELSFDMGYINHNNVDSMTKLSPTYIYFMLQLYFPNTKLFSFDSTKGEIPKTETFIADKNMVYDSEFKAVIISNNNDAEYVLWQKINVDK